MALIEFQMKPSERLPTYTFSIDVNEQNATRYGAELAEKLSRRLWGQWEWRRRAAFALFRAGAWLLRYGMEITRGAN